VSAEQKVERVRSLRRKSWIMLGAVPILLYVAYFVHGVFLADKANDAHSLHKEVKGSGVASDCDRDPTYLWAVWSCDVTITLANPGVTILSPTGQSSFTATLTHSQLTPDDIGVPKPMTAHPTVNPFGKGFVWSVADQEQETSAATVLKVYLGACPIMVLACLTIAQNARRRARRLEKKAAAQSVGAAPGI
jgi:hypothetical protein